MGLGTLVWSSVQQGWEIFRERGGAKKERYLEKEVEPKRKNGGGVEWDGRGGGGILEMK